MKKKRRFIEAEGLAFLDIITCGFGAIILLLIVVKPVPDFIDFVEEEMDLSAAIESGAAAVAMLTAELDGLRAELSEIPQPENQQTDSQIDQSIETAKTALQELKSSSEALELVKQTEHKTSILQTTNPKQRDPEVGGIPVDSEYVIFIVDTSGSMGEIWDHVVDVMDRVIDIHPKVKGFQIMNDNGNYLFASTRRQWLPDTPASRKNVKKGLRHWQSFSNSSPVEGLEIALRTYGNKRNKISIYIVGDDYTGSSYDSVINTLQRLNINKTTGEAKVRVHSIGFLSPYGSHRFPTLMRAVVEQNRGAFLGLPN